MGGLYPEDKIIDIFGKKIKFPGLDKEGKYTNGDFSNPEIPPSRLDARTINLIVDNLNSLIAALGGDPNNTGDAQLASLFASSADAHKAVQRDAAKRAKMGYPVVDNDIAVLGNINQFGICSTAATVAAKTVSIPGFVLLPGAKAVIKFSCVNTATGVTLDVSGTGAKAVYKKTTPLGSKDIVPDGFYGFVFDGTYWQLLGDTSTGDLDSHISAKENPHNVTKVQVGLGNVPNVATNDQAPTFAPAAAAAPLISGEKLSAMLGKISKAITDSIAHIANRNNPHNVTDVDMVDGYHAGTVAGCLTPISAFNFSGNSGYIKWANGFIWQFSIYKPMDDTGDATITLPLSFSGTNYKQFVLVSDGTTYSGDGNSTTREMFCSVRIDAQRVKIRRITQSNGCSVFAFGF